MKKWTQEETELLYSLKETNTIDEIVKIMGRTKESIKSKWKKLNYKGTATLLWPVEDLDLIKSGLSLQELGELLPHHTKKSIATKKEALGNYDDYRNCSDEYLLSLVKKYGDKNILNSMKEPDEPSAGVIERRFGSWSTAMLLAGLYESPKHNKPTILYLVDFGTFKKVGITQRTIKKRFKGFPIYTILDYIILEDWFSAYSTEQEILRNVKKYQYIGDLPNGNTECFVWHPTELISLI